MKRQIVPAYSRENIVTMDDLINHESFSEDNEFNYFGVEIDGERGFVTKDINHNFTIMIPRGLMVGNGFSSCDSPIFKEFVVNCFIKNFPIYKFSTFIELMTWINDANINKKEYYECCRKS